MNSGLIIIRGGGDLASGVALRLKHSGFSVIICELPQPLTIRRSVAFSEAIYVGEVIIEDVKGILVTDETEIGKVLIKSGEIPVLVDSHGDIIRKLEPEIVIDASLKKKYVPRDIPQEYFLIGLGPGFTAGENCDVVIETNRGHFLGRVIWRGAAQDDTGVPGEVMGHAKDRVIYSPASGEFIALKRIGEIVIEGEAIAKVGEIEIKAPFAGVIRGMLHDRMQVSVQTKVADIDPRNELVLCQTVSEKALAIGGGVLEAILAHRAFAEH